jgi:putative SOS response-associated peptidase YedK
MCGRASLTKNEKELEDRFGSEFYSDDIERYNPVPNYNLAPGQFFPVITNKDPGHFSIFKWGLLPFWSKDPKVAFKLINARAETLDSKPAFKAAFERRRCLVPLDGFYEWAKRDNLKVPYRIVKTDYSIFSVAGIWESWSSTNGEEVFTFSIITVNANNTVSALHNRMPAILFEDEEKLWLDDSIKTSDLKSMLKPFPADLVFAYPVSSRVNNVRNNDADLIVHNPEETIIRKTLF